MQKKHRENLEKLGRYLAKLTADHNVRHFRMEEFMFHYGKMEDEELVGTITTLNALKLVKEHFCGTSACALGHIPLAMPREFKRIEFVGWNQIAWQLFGIDRYDPEWDFLFGGHWSYVVDPYYRTSWAAADRIGYILTHDNDGYSSDDMKDAEGTAMQLGWITKRKHSMNLSAAKKIARKMEYLVPVPARENAYA
jgi:hypothetical protein